MTSSSKADFSTIARALLLGRKSEQQMVKLEVQDTPKSVICPTTSSVLERQGLLPGQDPSREFDCICDFCTSLRCMTAEMLSQRSQRVRPSGAERPKYGRRAKDIILRVRQFFDELKDKLGQSGRGTMFDKPAALTAAACGVSKWTVTAVARERDTSFRNYLKTRYGIQKIQRMTAVKRSRQMYGAFLCRFIYKKLRNKSCITLASLERDLYNEHPEVLITKTIFHLLIRAMGFSLKSVGGQRYVFARSDASSVLANDR
ncbi:hypothetical protein Q1695_001206 [Nippostrongylus brasiliensis]|nr:hypothetical protein Q1695_001206 [Nippostrongylus brasiliensis]